MTLPAVSTTKQAAYTKSEKSKFIKNLKEWAENDYLLSCLLYTSDAADE